MSQGTNEIVIYRMENTGLIPVFYHPDSETCKSILNTAYKSGIQVFEFTNRGPNALEIFRELVDFSKDFKSFHLGIGTIFSIEEAEKFIKAGAEFVVSPALLPELGKYCSENNSIWIPGCGSITEIYRAHELGAPVVKIFPGNVLGSGFVKAAKAVMPEVRMMPTGGVKPSIDSLSSWFQAGVSCVGMGSQLIPKAIIEQKAFAELEALFTDTLVMIKAIREKQIL